MTARTAVFLPGRDHAGGRGGCSASHLPGTVWLDAHQCKLYAREGFVVPASDGAIFYDDLARLEDRLRAHALDDV